LCGVDRPSLKCDRGIGAATGVRAVGARWVGMVRMGLVGGGSHCGGTRDRVAVGAPVMHGGRLECGKSGQSAPPSGVDRPALKCDPAVSHSGTGPHGAHAGERSLLAPARGVRAGPLDEAVGPSRPGQGDVVTGDVGADLVEHLVEFGARAGVGEHDRQGLAGEDRVAFLGA
jgi:hypothetical protein